MPFATPVRWNPARPATGVCRVEVWSQGEQIGSVDQTEVKDGKVTDKRGTGIRRSLTLTVDASAKWLKWAQLPGLELRPFSGFSWGTSEFLCPMGRYPIYPPKIALPRKDVQFSANDYWSWVARNKYSVPRPAPVGEQIRHDARQLLVECKIPYLDDDGLPLITASSQATLPQTTRDKGAHESIVQDCEAIGAEGFIDRAGRPIVQDIATPAGRALVDGDDGTLRALEQDDINWAEVPNAIVISPASDDTPFTPYRLSITDRDHPAHESRIGPMEFGYSSPLITTYDQAYNAAPWLLAKAASTALTWTATALFDPSVDSGDAVPVSCDLGDFSVIIQQVVHDLAGGDMSLTLGAA